MTTENVERIENKLDTVNSDVKQLTRAIHEQSVSIVRLCEQMNNSTEALGRAHHRIDTVGSRVEKLRDLPTKVEYLERRVGVVEKRQEKAITETVGNSVRIAEGAGAKEIIHKWGLYLIMGIVLAAMGIIGKLV